MKKIILVSALAASLAAGSAFAAYSKHGQTSGSDSGSATTPSLDQLFVTLSSSEAPTGTQTFEYSGEEGSIKNSRGLANVLKKLQKQNGGGGRPVISAIASSDSFNPDGSLISAQIESRVQGTELYTACTTNADGNGNLSSRNGVVTVSCTTIKDNVSTRHGNREARRAQAQTNAANAQAAAEAFQLCMTDAGIAEGSSKQDIFSAAEGCYAGNYDCTDKKRKGNKRSRGGRR